MSKKTKKNISHNLNASEISKEYLVPNIIHLYWDNVVLPPFIKGCVNNIKSLNPEWEVIVYSFEDVLKEPSHPKFCEYEYTLESLKDNHIRFISDWFRLHLLYTYGGIYIDISCICLAPFSKFIDQTCPYIQGFYIDKFKSMENWFICSPPKNKFIYDWMKETIISHNDMYGAEHKYSEENYKYGGKDLHRWLPYLVQHLAFKKLSILNPKVKHRIILEAISKNGPYCWDLFKGQKDEKIKRLLNMRKEDFKNHYLLKLNGSIRNIFIQKFENQSKSYLISLISA